MGCRLSVAKPKVGAVGAKGAAMAPLPRTWLMLMALSMAACDPTVGDSDAGEVDAEIVEACMMPDAAVDASFSLVSETWEDIAGAGSFYAWYSVEEACEVLSVDVADGSWATALDCGEDRLATLTIAAPAKGRPAWETGETLTLDADGNLDETVGSESIQLLREDEVLVHILRGGTESGPVDLVRRLGAEPSHEECDAPPLEDGSSIDGEGRLALHFEQGDGETVIVSGHRGSITLEGGTSLEIDVAEATSGNCCHSAVALEVLMRQAVVE